MYGISVKNTSGHILISSEVNSLHFGGNATFQSTLVSGLTDFPGYSGDDGGNTLSGRHVHRYAFASQDPPVFFIQPSNYAFNHGVLQQFQSGVYWFVDVIQSGNYSAPPTVKAFVPPANLAAPLPGVGVAAYDSLGQATFDSRLRPLAISAAVTVLPPTLPCDGGRPTNQSGYGWNDANLDFNFRSNTTSTSYVLSGQVAQSNLMFSGPAIAQAVYIRQKNGYKRSSGNYSSQEHWSTALWWAMYNAAYRVTNTTLYAGWAVYSAGFYFSSTYEGGGFGGGGGGGSAYGSRPFDDKTINLSSNTVIVADASVYI